MRITWLTIILFAAACQSAPDYKPDSYLDPKKKDEVLDRIIRYAGALPKKTPDSARFDEKHDAYYRELASKHRLTHYYVSGDGEHFFLLTRPAASLVKKFVATGGRMRFNAADSLIEYEEVFRTWRLTPDTLARRSELLFDKMVKGESLEPYLTRNSGGVEYIEFPDERTWYDKASRNWKIFNPEDLGY